MMKHAYLIIAHNEWEVLNLLLRMLDDERNDIYLHIDKKVRLIPQLVECKNAGFQLLSERNDVRWGDFSQVQTEMLLFETAYSHGPYAYYHLLSGVDLPLKSQDEIHAFFNQNQGKEFVGFFQGKYHEDDVMRKVSRYYVLMQWNKRCPFLPKWKIMVGQLLRHSLLALQKLMGIRRKMDKDYRKGHQWVSLTNDAVKMLLDNRQWMERRMRNVNTPDEIFIQTLIWNSDFRQHLYSEGYDGNMRFIDWQRGEPYCWQDADLDELLASPYMFARKFSASQQQLLKRLAETY